MRTKKIATIDAYDTTFGVRVDSVGTNLIRLDSAGSIIVISRGMAKALGRVLLYGIDPPWEAETAPDDVVDLERGANHD